MTRREHVYALAQWVAGGVVAGLICGSASALFLFALDRATNIRLANELIVFSLPVAGLVIGWLYEKYGAKVLAGNNLVIDTIHDEGPEIPVRMAPMVLIGTVLTHLFGGSAGREGTAVQMGASLTDWVSHRLGVSKHMRRQLLAAGVAAGFGSVFGTPIAGAVFGLEFIVLGHLEYDAFVPALVASVIGDMTTRAWGIEHAHYPTVAHTDLTVILILKWVVVAAAVAIATRVFIELTHALKHHSEQRLKRLPYRMAVGGAVVVLLWQLVGTSDYLGLGVPMILRSFSDPSLPTYAFALKLLFTAVTLGAGFLGGEVTPLFFVGAALGSTMGKLLGIPPELAAGVGMAAVFAAASNTPLALSIMAIELLGGSLFPHVMIVCVLAYLFTGHRSIYPAQRVTRYKGGRRLTSPLRLRELAAKHDRAQSPGANGTPTTEPESGAASALALVPDIVNGDDAAPPESNT